MTLLIYSFIKDFSRVTKTVLSKETQFKEAEKWSFKSKIWKPKISFFVIKKP